MSTEYAKVWHPPDPPSTLVEHLIRNMIPTLSKVVPSDLSGLKHRTVHRHARFSIIGVIGWLKYPLHVVCVHGAVSAHSVGV